MVGSGERRGGGRWVKREDRPKGGSSMWDTPEEKKRKCREARADEVLIRRQLGLGKSGALPRCPARSRKRVLEFLSEGDATHDAPGHLCHLCGCLMVAGHGTDHYGYGYCHLHERISMKVRGAKCTEQANLTHRRALIERHPGVYRDQGRFADMIRREAEEAQELLSLREEIQIMRGEVQKVILRSQGMEKDDEGREVFLTEYIDGELKRMSDRTMLSIMPRLITAVGKVAKTEFEMQLDKMISDPQFKLWFSKLWTLVTELSRKVDSREIIRGEDLLTYLMNGIKAIGDPRSIRIHEG